MICVFNGNNFVPSLVVMIKFVLLEVGGEGISFMCVCVCVCVCVCQRIKRNCVINVGST